MWLLGGRNAELALSLLSGIRVLVEAVDALDGLDDSAARRLANITPEQEERHRVQLCEPSRPVPGSAHLGGMPGRFAADRPTTRLAAAARLFWPGRCTFAELYWSTTRKLAFRCLKDLIALGILSNRLSLKFL